MHRPVFWSATICAALPPQVEPSTTVALSGKEAEQMLRLADALEDLDDVQNFYANFDISDEELANFA